MSDRVVLDEPAWTARAERFAERLEAFLGPLLTRVRAGDPVPEFLFSYYGLRPGRLRCWQPGFGVALRGDAALRAYSGRRGYITTDGQVTVGTDFLQSRSATVGFIARLLRATAGRPAALNCFGLHEWAMLYRSDTARHGHVPLRLSGPQIDAVVAASALRCTHFDAFRFFTAEAAPRNAGAPTRTDQADWEQPGCLHANMDLFKWCLKLAPLVDSELVLDCLQLAAAAREVDMRASPYDLTGYGYAPITIEEPAGRADYVRCQSAIAERAAVLRASLLARCDLLLQALQQVP